MTDNVATIGEVIDAEFDLKPEGDQPPAAEETSPPADTEPTPAEAGERVEPEASEAPEVAILEEIAEAERAAHQKKLRWEALKEETKNAKAMFDAAIDHLCMLIRSKTEEMPLFDQPAVAEAAGPVDPEDDAPQVEDESWRDVPLGDVLSGLPPSIVSALNESGLKTVGELADASKNPQFKMTDIPGIGPVKAEKVEAALEEFWKRRAAAAKVPEGQAELDQAAEEEASEE